MRRGGDFISVMSHIVAAAFIGSPSYEPERSRSIAVREAAASSEIGPERPAFDQDNLAPWRSDFFAHGFGQAFDREFGRTINALWLRHAS